MRISMALAAAAGTLALSACTTAEFPSGTALQAGFSASSAGTAPSRPEQAGYRLVGESFETELVFVEADGEARLAAVHRVAGADPLRGELRFAEPWLADGVHAFEGESDEGLALDIVLEPGPCEAGGRSYGYFAQLRAGRISYTGCAGETGSYTRWSNRIADHLPAIEACQDGVRSSTLMAFAGSGSRRVIHARREGSAHLVRYEFPGSGRFDCRVEYGAVSWRPVPGEAPELDSERDPVFLPGQWPEAGEDCMLYARVRDREGELLGALGYDVCMAVGFSGPPGPLG